MNRTIFFGDEMRPVELTIGPDEKVEGCDAAVFSRFLVGKSATEASAFLTDLSYMVSTFAAGNASPENLVSPRLESFFDFLDRERNSLQPSEWLQSPAAKPTLHLVHNTELVLLGLLCFCRRRQQNRACKSSQTWLVVDLPPGVGKTYAIEKLAALVNAHAPNSVVISAPTMKTALLYNKSLRANTLHANFMLKVGANSKFSADNPIVRRGVLARGELFVFDEFSMYGSGHIVDILLELRRQGKSVIVIGDSCQMPPVQQQSLSWFEHASPVVGLPFAAYIAPHVNVAIPRIDANECGFRQLILAVRQCILRGILARVAGERETGEPVTKKARVNGSLPAAPKYALDAAKMKLWVEKLSMFRVVKDLPVSTALVHLAARQNRILYFVSNLRSSGFFDPARYSADFLENTINRHLPPDLPLNLPVFAGYENALNLEVCAALQSKCKIAESSGHVNVVFDKGFGSASAVTAAVEEHTSARPKVLNSVMLPRTFFQSRVLEEIARLLPTITALENTFYPGMVIRSRENVRSQGIHNNQTAIFLTFRVREPWRFQSIKRSEYSLPVGLVKGKSTDCVTQFELEESGEQSVADASRLVEMIAIDVQSRRMLTIRPVVKFLCEGCERGASCCNIHLAEASRVCFLCFNWTVYYTNTIFNLQGSTISDDRLFLLPQHVFKRNRQRTLYILLSRCARPSQIITDTNFVRNVIAIIFNSTVARVETFLKKNAITITENTTLEEIFDL